MMFPGNFNPSQSAISQKLAQIQAEREAKKAQGGFMGNLGPVGGILSGLGAIAGIIPGLGLIGPAVAAAGGAAGIGSGAASMAGVGKMTPQQMYQPPTRQAGILPPMSAGQMYNQNQPPTIPMGRDPALYRQALLRLRF